MRLDLVPNTGLAISISILPWVQLVHKPRLLGGCASGVVIPGSGSSCGASGVVIPGSGSSCGASGVVIPGSGSSCGASVVTVMAGGAGGASGASEGTSNSSWLTLEPIITLFTAGQAPALLLEVCHADSGQRRCGVVLAFIVVDFVDGDGGVDDGWLDSLLVDDWLDGLGH